jgi:hypothetical protein
VRTVMLAGIDAVKLLLGFQHELPSALQARQLAVTEDSQFLFHPSGSAIQVCTECGC